MMLTLNRDVLTPDFTLGTLTINGITRFYTCEDAVRDVKIKGKTAIPAGTYNVIINFSNRFQRQMPLIENVPGFSGIRIHGGNTAEDTEGCILVGTARAKNGVKNCLPALTLLQMDIQRELDAGKKVTLTVVENAGS